MPDMPELPEPRYGRAWTETERVALDQLIRTGRIDGWELPRVEAGEKPAISARLILAWLAARPDPAAELHISGVSFPGTIQIADATLRSFKFKDCDIVGGLLFRGGKISDGIEIRDTKVGGPEGFAGLLSLRDTICGSLEVRDVSAAVSLRDCAVRDDCSVFVAAETGLRTSVRLRGGQFENLYLGAATVENCEMDGVEVRSLTLVGGSPPRLFLRNSKFHKSVSIGPVSTRFSCRKTDFEDDLFVDAGPDSEITIEGGSIGGGVRIGGSDLGTLFLSRVSVTKDIFVRPSAAATIIVNDTSCRSLYLGRLGTTDLMDVGNIFLVGLAMGVEFDATRISLIGRALVDRVLFAGQTARFADWRISDTRRNKGGQPPSLTVSGCEKGNWSFPDWPISAAPALRFTDCAVKRLELPSRGSHEVDLSGSTYANLALLDVDKDWKAILAALTSLLARGPADPKIYLQLADSQRSAGYPARANDILYAERRRAMGSAWSAGERTQFVWLSILRATIGFGIGLRTLRVLYSIGALTLIGAAVLYLPATSKAPHDLPWCLGASLHRLLPFPLSARYTAFFDGKPPYQPDHLLTYAQNGYFVIHAALGWALSLFLLAGITGLSRKS